MRSGRRPHTAGRAADWKSIVLLTFLLVNLLVLMEWLFFVTKPSFLSVLGLSQKAMVLGLTPVPFLILACTVLGPLLIAMSLVKTEMPRRVIRFLAVLVPTTVLGSLYVLMADNFTNTIWGLAIEKSAGPWRVLVAVGILGLFYLAYRSVESSLTGIRSRFRLWVWTGRALAAVSLALLVTVFARSLTAGSSDVSRLYPALAERPNIVILGGDGLNANHLSCYGYEKDTTPFLKTLVPNSLFCENCFANCSHTTGSLASILTGRLPTEIRVTYPPDILTGQDAYRHLPGLLKKFGYRTSQISIRHYGDAYDVNLRDGFDTANFRKRETAQAASRLSGILGMESSFFVEQVLDRIRVRLAHAVGLNYLPSAFQEVEHGSRLEGHTDTQRFQGLMAILRATPEPFFAHAHFMGTHGAFFNPSRQTFSAGMEQDRKWIIEFYDDAIWDFDMIVRVLMDTLRQRGVLENTLIVIYSDHGMRSDSRHRTPLMFYFPETAFAGRISGNVQALDIAPTILDYLGVEVPDWMNGQSLLAGHPNPLRPVFSTRFRDDALKRLVPKGPFEIDADLAGPPFYSVGSLIMVVGQRVYSLDLIEQQMEIHDLADHSSPHPEEDLPSPEEAETMMIAHIKERGFDVSGLELPLSKRFLP